LGCGYLPLCDVVLPSARASRLPATDPASSLLQSSCHIESQPKVRL